MTEGRVQGPAGGVPEQGWIGARIPLIDARRKATGEAIYTDDIKLPGMLIGKILRSPLAHARIVRLDLSKAKAIPGVYAAVSGQDNQGKFGVLPITQDETPFAGKKVLFVGDQVAAVAAIDEETALEALAAIEVEYEELKPFLKPKDSLKKVPEELQLHPERSKDGSNVMKKVEQHFGDVPAALEKAALKVTGKFAMTGVTHAFTEPHCVIAHYDTEDHLTLWSATQVPHYVHRALAKVLEMPMHRIQVIRPMVGGAFGGKSDPFPHEMAAALLSKQCRRPVKILFDREEVFISNHGRHPTTNQLTVGLDSEGKLSVFDLDVIIDGGAWGSFGVVTTYYNGVLSQGPYRMDNFRFRCRRVYSNKPPCGAMRGHGAVNTRFAYETLIDELCERSKQDPVQFRIDNALPSFTKTINEFRITSNGVVECLERARAASGWVDKHGKMPFGRGIGVACGFYISGSALPIHWTKLPQSTVHIKIDMDGGITVHSMAAEIGQGSDTMLAQCVAEVLRCDLGRIRVYSGNSDTAPIDLGSYSSRVTFMAGNAARRAALKIKDKLVRAAGKKTGYPWEGFVLDREELVFAPNPDIRISFADALEEALAENGALIAKGAYQGPPKMGGSHKGAAAGLAPTYSFSAFITEVVVDPDTGYVQVEKVWAAHDCGKALNPLSVEGQIEGSIHMGLGQALMEDFRYNKAGILNANLLDYRTPSPMQMPDVEVILVETNDPEGPYGAKECGEGPLLPILPAVANAIHDAVGVRMRELPMTPDIVWKAMQQKKKREQRQPELAQSDA